MKYDLQIDKAISFIKDNNLKRVLLQLPDGLKQDSKKIADSILKEADAEIYIWIGSCFGACDIPQGIEKAGIQAIIQWGHNEFIKTQSWR